MGEWPDWAGLPVAIIASGPSAKKAGVDLLKDRIRTFAIKGNVDLAPWSEAVYGCDYPWWRHVRGLPNYTGLKLAYADKACDQFGCQKVSIPDHATSDALRFDTVGTVGGGGNSGFQALNLALQFGAKRILLIGFDCQDRSGAHWYGRNHWQGAGNPTSSNFRRWKAAFAGAASTMTEMGVEVINASPISDLAAFPCLGVAEALEQWNL